MKVSLTFGILVVHIMLKEYKTSVLELFKEKIELNGFICSPKDYVFAPSINTSKTLCAIRCTMNDSCASLFYDPSSLKCFGCKLYYNTGELNETLSGSLYYDTNEILNTTYGQSFYFSGPKEQTFEEAVVYCAGQNAHVVEAETTEENEYLKTYFMNQQLLTGYEIWLGITDNDVEGVWKWNSSGAPLGGFFDWGQDSPRNMTNRNCAKFTEGRHRKWADYPCMTQINMFTFCERVET
ncbi:C-type lectin domain family 1 member B-like [Ruditapes philippinarum]|uniref:C-type lectin domain family 1 member B-like n=1 Tax=Ruditapes philippinarum TaxID=129788 RepID=UPI00295A7AA4|nr:C-type lectin domain family 1 member B-like [Ruditapes philippinarum]